MSFKLSYTNYLFALFQKQQHNNLKCAYTSSQTYDFDGFQTEKCSTEIVNDKNQVIYSSQDAQTQDVDDIPFLEKVGYAFEYVTIQCQCQHMSYYTVIEDIPLIKIEQERFQQYLNSIRNFKDWPTALIGIYIVLLIFAGLLAARGSDKEDERAMKAAEEAPELEVGAAKAENGMCLSN